MTITRPLRLRERRIGPKVGLVLDIDETLMNCSEPLGPDFDIWSLSPEERIGWFPIQMGGNWYKCYIRPGLNTFIVTAFEVFDYVAVWTAATSSYADDVISHIMPGYLRNRLHCFFTRDDCAKEVNDYHKPLKKIDVDGAVFFILDDRENNFKDNRDVGILIPEFCGCSKDNHLKSLTEYIRRNSDRDLLKSMYKISGEKC